MPCRSFVEERKCGKFGGALNYTSKSSSIEHILMLDSKSIIFHSLTLLPIMNDHIFISFGANQSTPQKEKIKEKRKRKKRKRKERNVTPFS